MKKLSMFLTVIAFSLVSGIQGVHGQTVTDVDDIEMTADEYEEFLESELENVRVAHEDSIKEDLETFKNLSEEEQERFLDLVTDVDIAREIFETSSKVTSDGETRTLADGDITITSNTNVSQDDDEPINGVNFVNVDAFGITWITYRQEIRYTVNENEHGNERIDEILSGSHIVTANNHPLLYIEVHDESNYIHGDIPGIRATSEAVAVGTFGIEGYGITVGHHLSTVTGWPNGYVNGHIYPNE